MKVGDVVSQSVVRVDRPGINATFKPEKGEVAMLLVLGSADKKDPDSFSGVKALNDLGWIREGVRAEEVKSLKDLLIEIRDEMKSDNPNLSILYWNDKFNKIL